jgi:hypothetical protein
MEQEKDQYPQDIESNAAGQQPPELVRPESGPFTVLLLGQFRYHVACTATEPLGRVRAR